MDQNDTLYYEVEVIRQDEYEVGLETGTAVEKEHYSGKYNIEPSFSKQTLNTRDKYMENDVTVSAIQVSRVTNQTGGNTIFIGGIINA